MTTLRTERTWTGCDSRVYKSQGDHSILMEMLLVWEELQEKFRREHLTISSPRSLSASLCWFSVCYGSVDCPDWRQHSVIRYLTNRTCPEWVYFIVQGGNRVLAQMWPHFESLSTFLLYWGLFKSLNGTQCQILDSRSFDENQRMQKWPKMVYLLQNVSFGCNPSNQVNRCRGRI